MKAYKITEKLWRFEENTVGVFSPSKFTINLLNNKVTIVYHNNLKSLVVKVVDLEVYDIGATSPFTTSSGVALMTKLAELNCPCFHKDENNFYGNNFDPANFDLEEFTNTSTNPFIRQDELGNFDEFIEGYFDGTNFYTDALFTNLITPELNKYYVDLATTPSKIYRWSGTTFVAVGGGGSSFIYDFLCPLNNFPASTLAYTMRFNVSSPIFNPIFEASTYYNWLTDNVGNTGITAHPVISNQKVKKIVFSYNKVSTSISIKLIYFKVTGINNASLDNLVIFQKTISNPSGFKQISIDIPTEIELEAGGFISMALFNNNVACTVANLHIKLLTETV